MNDLTITRLSSAKLAPAYPKLSVSRSGWINFGVNNMFPQEIVKINSRSPVNGAIIESKVTYICGKGIRESINADNEEKLNEIVGAPNSKESWDDFLEKLAQDYVTFGGFCFQVVPNLGGEKVTLFHQDFSAVRIGKLDPSTSEAIDYRIADDWTKTSGKYRPIELESWRGSLDTTEEGKAYLYYYADYRPDLNYYPVPSYYNALEYVKADGELGAFYNNSINNGFTPSVVITMPSNPEEEKKSKFQRDMENAFSGSKGANSVVVIWGENKEVSPVIEPFNASANADIYNNIEGIIFQKIISAHRLSSPTLAGVSGSGNLSGNASEIVDSFIMFNYTVIEKLRRKLLDHINIFTKINRTKELYVKELEVVTKIRESASEPEYQLKKISK